MLFRGSGPEQREGPRLPAPFKTFWPVWLAAAGLDIARRAGLVVRRGAGDGVPDAVAAERRDRDLDVLDPGVIRLLELGQRHAQDRKSTRLNSSHTVR